MAERQIDFENLKDGEAVTLRLREGESVIVGTVEPGFTARGGRTVKLTNNANSVVIYAGTNFRIFADRSPSVAELLADKPIGTVFTYRNKYDVTIKWVKSGADRATRVDNNRPAYSLSLSVGFSTLDDTEARLTVEH